MAKTVLITGASSGFGKLTTEALLDAGYTVVASMRNIDTRNKAAADELTQKGAKVVEIDVTDDASVASGVGQAGDIDILINNAGIGVLGMQETFTVEDWQRLFDINVFGVQRMNRAVIPGLRQKQDGLLIHISSLLGRFCLPFFGPYNASKHALEALADNYRVELSGFGIESILVEPGGFGTEFGSRLLQPSDKDRLDGYGDFAQVPEQMMADFGKNFEKPDAPQPTMVSDAIVKLVQMDRGTRPFRTVVDGLGMAPPIEAINAVSDQSTKGIYSAFGMEPMLTVKS